MKNHIVYNLPKGADQDFVIEVTDVDDLPVDLTTFDKVFLLVYYPDRVILKKYSATTEDDYELLEIIGDDNNELSFRLYSDDTILATPSIVRFEVITKIEDIEEGSGHDDIYNTIVTDQYLCTIVDSITRTISLP